VVGILLVRVYSTPLTLWHHALEKRLGIAYKIEPKTKTRKTKTTNIKRVPSLSCDRWELVSSFHDRLLGWKSFVKLSRTTRQLILIIGR
jgi:hypothetical protein